MLATTTRATRPTPNQAICRRATPPPTRPTCREARVDALRMTRPTAAPSNGQSTFCSSRRSIPTIRLAVGAPAQASGARRSAGRSAQATPSPRPVGAPAQGSGARRSGRESARRLQPRSSAKAEAGDLLEEDGVEDLAGDRCGHLATLAAALDQD